MYDKRVIRGNTYALHVFPSNAQPEPLELQQKIERRKRALANRRIKEELQPKSPMPLEGKLNQPVQTELYLEALTNHLEEAEIDCQTDEFLDRPPTPLYIPAKTGHDCETQVYDGDLFNFDLEVTPILEVLIGKTIEQALLETIEEEELANIRAQQTLFEEIRQSDLLEVHRLIDRQRRINEEKERRKTQSLELAMKEQELADKVAAKAFAKAYLADLQPNVFNNLAENGYFYDPVERDIENEFLPWIMNEIDEEIELENNSRLLLDAMIREVVQERHHEYRQLELIVMEKALAQTAGTSLTDNTDQETNEPKHNLETDQPSERLENEPTPAVDNGEGKTEDEQEMEQKEDYKENEDSDENQEDE